MERIVNNGQRSNLVVIALFRKISLEGKVLLGISFTDCFLTTLLIQFNLATEFNPLMDFLLKQGVGVFIVGKIGISVILIALLELFRNKYPSILRYIQRCQRIAIVCYMLQVALPSLIFMCI